MSGHANRPTPGLHPAGADLAFESLRIDTPAKLAVAVPYLVGYQPDNELVALGYHGGAIQATARITANEVRRFGFDCTAWRLASHGTTAVHLIAYGPAAEADPAVFAARDACTRKGLDVVEVLRIHDGCWWSYRYPDNAAEPIVTGTARERRLADAFSNPAASTDMTALELEPITGAQAEAIRQLTAQTETRLAARRRTASDAQVMYEALKLVEALTDTGQVPDLNETATIAAFLSTTDLAEAIEEMTIVIIHDGGEHNSMMLWTWLTARLPEALRWRSAALAAYAAWVNDNTELAADAADLSLSLRCAHSNRIASRIHQAISNNIGINDDNASGYLISLDDD